MDAEATELIAEARVLDSLHLLGITILIWDHILTFGREVQFVWLRRKSVSSVWFFVVRYLGLLSNILVLLFSFATSNFSTRVCLEYALGHQVLLLLTQLMTSFVMILRTWALYNRSKVLLGSLIGAGVSLLAVSLWAEHGQRAIPVASLPGCHTGVSANTAYHLSASWVALFVFDSLIFGLTLRRTVLARREFGHDAPLPLHMLLVRDGAVYFVLMAFANLSNIVTEYLTGPLVRGSLSTFANCISISMMCRLMLNLHRAAHLGVLSRPSDSLPDVPFTGASGRSVVLDLEEDEQEPPVYEHELRDFESNAGVSSSQRPTTERRPRER